MGNIIFLAIVIVILLIILHIWKNRVQKPSLYDRLGGIFAIAAVVNRFSDKVIQNPKVGIDSPNPFLRDWSRNKLDRLAGLKFMRTLWVCDVAGGPYKYVPTKPGHDRLGLENAHCQFHITSDEFDEVAKELSDALDFYKVPAQEKSEVLAAFAGHKNEVTSCPFASNQ